MSDKNELSTERGERSALERRLPMSKRRFLRVLLAGATSYSVPVMLSFSMEGVRLGQARAQSQRGDSPPGFSAANQTPGGRESPPGFSAANQTPAQERSPFFGPNQQPPGGIRSR